MVSHKDILHKQSICSSIEKGGIFCNIPNRKYIFLLNLWWCAWSSMLHECEFILHRSNHKCFVQSFEYWIILSLTSITILSVVFFFYILYQSSIIQKLKHKWKWKKENSLIIKLCSTLINKMKELQSVFKAANGNPFFCPKHI